jgi:phosphate-selective porin OprO/OprP
MHFYKVVAVFAFVILVQTAFSQASENKPAVNVYVKKQKGVGLVAADSTFSLNFQFRLQARAAYFSESEHDLNPEGFEFRVRRLRMKFDGFVLDPRLSYYIQLSFSRGDMDWSGPDNATVNSSPNIVRDAVIYFTPNAKWRFGFGQTKLPGNRQRVISSGDLQFYDRSIVNATFNIDRDFGFFANYTGNYFNVRGAVTSGEGRNSIMSDEGLAYTGRLEFLPLGKFTGNNDYIEGDFEREKTPKISLGTTYSYNANAVRTAGQLGNDLYDLDPHDLENFEVDMLVKYNGWALYNEYMTRETNNPINPLSTDPTKTRFIYVGQGMLSQLSYIFRNKLEFGARYAKTKPSSDLYNDPNFPSVNEMEIDQYELGVTKYLNGHRVKIQGGIIYSVPTDLHSNIKLDGMYSVVFQIEVGI